MTKKGHLSAFFLHTEANPAQTRCRPLALILLATLITITSQAQTVDPPPAQNPGANATAPANQGGELEQITVTGYLIPRVGEGPQPVTNYDRSYIEKTGSQTTSDILQNLPAAVGNFAPATTTGFSFSPASASIGLKGLPPNDTLVLVDGLRFRSTRFPKFLRLLLPVSST
jgi:outer membrane cobalamin receptor